MTDEAPETGTTVVVAPPRPKAELVTSTGGAVPIIPRNIEEVARVAAAIFHAGLAPNSYKGANEEEVRSKIVIGIMKGAEIGLAPLTALASIAIINGRPCLWGDGAVGLVQASGKVEDWTETYEGTPGTDDYTAICRITRRGQTGVYEGRFSVGDARRAKLLTKGPWVEYLSRMLMWRARTYAMRTGFADALCGLSIVEEVQDIPAAPTAVNSATFLADDAPDEVVETPVDAGGQAADVKPA